MKLKESVKITDKLITLISSWAASITIVACVIWGIKILWSHYRYEQTNDAQVEEYINPVIARVGGYIKAVKFEENQYVKKGDTLLLIDNREYEYEQAQTSAEIQKQYAALAVLESNKHTLEKSAASVQSLVSANKAKMWKSEQEFNRYQKLHEQHSATGQHLEDVKTELDVATSEYTASLQDYDVAKSKITDVETQKSVLYAEISRLEALIKRNELDVDYTVIRAAYNGRMGKRKIEVGQMISPGEVLAYIVNDETAKWVVANFKETQIKNTPVGKTVRIIADAYPDLELEGKIISIAPATGSSFSLLPPDNSTGNFVKIVQRIPVRIEILGDSTALGLLKSGMNVNVFVKK